MHKLRWTLPVILLAVGLATGLVACGDKNNNAATAAGDGGTSDGAGSGAKDSPNLGEKASKKITAASGGTIELAKAGVKLDIPGGALSKDTTISAEVVSATALPEQSTLAGEVIEFLPKGQQFEKPVTLSIDLGAAKAPKGSTATLSYFDDKTQKWVDLDGSKVVDGAVVADTTHFTIFAVRFIIDDTGHVQQTEGQCTDGFKACGGDPEGVWTITSGCASVPASVIEQITAQCKGQTFAFGLDITGDITFKAGKITGMLSTTSTTTQVVPKTCMQATTCPAADASKPEQTVTDLGDSCESKEVTTDMPEVGGTYEISGNMVTITDSKDLTDAGTPKVSMDEFCITGDTMVVQSHENNNVTVQWTATRQ